VKTQAFLVALVLLSALIIAGPTHAAEEETCIAVAANFTQTAKAIAERFEKTTGHKVTLVFGSTGKLYAQIKNGAPFDAFLSADTERPVLLEQEKIAIPDSRFTYATGRLVLWSPRAGFVDSEGKVLEQDGFQHLAIANPKLAPYGLAAQRLLETRGLWQGLQGRIVIGEDVAQTFHFIKTGNAELGFVAYSQIMRPGFQEEGSFWEVPQSAYEPIHQQAVLLKDNQTARDFLAFLRGDEALEIIGSFGYGRP